MISETETDLIEAHPGIYLERTPDHALPAEATLREDVAPRTTEFFPLPAAVGGYAREDGHHSDAALGVANYRLLICQAFDTLAARYAELGRALSINEGSRKLGVPLKPLWKYLRLWNGSGRDYNALIPAFNKRGAKSALAKLGLTAGALNALLDECQGLNLDLDSTTATLRVFAQSDRCPEELAAVILKPRRSKHSIPESIREAVAVNKAVKLAHRGPRALSLRGLWIPRRNDILAGDIFSSDDTTAIWGAWVPWYECEDYPFGVKLMQFQHLPVIDVASQCVITYALIARETSSYRAADIWALFGHVFDTIGIPRLGWQLERGSWEANLIKGEECTYEDGEVTMARRVGGLRQIPTNLTPWHHATMGEAASMFPKTLQTFTSYLPKSKSVEALINRSQTFEGTIYGSLGRDQMRRPFEKAKKLFQQCSRPRAKEDARLHFLSITEIAARLNRIYDYLNHEPMEGEVFSGVPKMKFDLALQEHPLLRLPEDQRWLYQRDWKRTPVAGPFVRVRLTHAISGERYSHFYRNERVFADMQGQDVIVYYDRERYEQPAQIISARTGEFVCEAEYFERVGSFLDGEKTGHEVCKAFKNAVMTTYGRLVAHAPSRQLPPEIAARREAAKGGSARAASGDASQREAVHPAITQHDGRPQPGRSSAAETEQARLEAIARAALDGRAD